MNYFWVLGLIATYLNKGFLPFNEEAFIALSSLFFFSCLYFVSNKTTTKFFFLQADAVYLILSYLLKLNIFLLKGVTRLYTLVSFSKKAIRFNLTRCLLI